ncbi:MAG: sulfotransferase [Planctomycetes bacterium]|nr:sulfotransferase [Planctomycetota bacterium]
MSLSSEIIVVSGLPRSGTSLMMQMLDKGGIEIVTDQLRTADPDNPKGYYEFEPAKSLKEDSSWLPSARGKAIKLVSMLLYDLPASERYRVLFMERDLEEVIHSQEKMLERLGRTAVPSSQMVQSYRLHLDKLNRWMEQQTSMSVLRIGYRDLVTNSSPWIQKINNFIGGTLNVEAMANAIDPNLYRNRNDKTE